MIKVIIYRNKNKEIFKYIITGHANAAKHGEDIVCAAVSVLSQTTVLGLHGVAKIAIDYEINDGKLTCNLPKYLTKQERIATNLLLETMYIGFKSLLENYSEYMKIHDKEV
ncbi:MAG: ribosomal-processing cysteine protease Prp [Clostridiales bacterium]|nr:ribosomal-processing cysteine protease Prp [Clostridiales bacterium]